MSVRWMKKGVPGGWDDNLAEGVLIERKLAALGLAATLVFALAILSVGVNVYVSGQLERRDFERPIWTLVSEQTADIVRRSEIIPEHYIANKAQEVASSLVSVNYLVVDEQFDWIREMMSDDYSDASDPFLTQYQNRIRDRLQIHDFKIDSDATVISTDQVFETGLIYVRFQGEISRYNGSLLITGDTQNPYVDSSASMVFQVVQPTREFPHGLELVAFEHPGFFNLRSVASPAARQMMSDFAL